MSLHKEFNISKSQFYEALLDIRSFTGTKQGKKRLDPKVRTFLVFLIVFIFLIGLSYYKNNFLIDFKLGLFVLFSLTASLVGFFVSIGIKHIMYKLWASRSYSSATALDHKQFISIGEDGFEAKCEISDSRLKWESFIKIEQGKKNFLFFIQRDLAIFIPLSLLDQQEIESIVSWFEKAQKQPL